MENMVQALLREIFPGQKASAVRCKGGMNNELWEVICGERRCALRIYQTHRDAGRVLFEHAVLKALGEQGMEFSIPKPWQGAAETAVHTLPDGSLVSVFQWIPGKNPALDTTEQIQQFGRMAGNLSRALAQADPGAEPAYQPYYCVEGTHPFCPPEKLEEICKYPPPELENEAVDLTLTGLRLRHFMSQRQHLEQLPHQLIHGDLNASNILENAQGNLCAVLDFEFVTRDLRVMELAVCLSDLLHATGDPEVWKKAEALLHGFGSAVRLTPEEVAVIPLLVELRRLDVVIHFMGRWLEGVDPVDVVKKQIQSAAAQIRWLGMYESQLRRYCDTWLTT